MDSGWTLEQDEELRAACERSGTEPSVKKLKWCSPLSLRFHSATSSEHMCQGAIMLVPY
jgi:hypothetical protein